MDQEEFLKNLRGCSRSLFNFLLHTLGDYEEARDALQTTLLKAWESRNGFEKRSQFKTWIFRIAINLAMDILRQKKNVPKEPLLHEPVETPYESLKKKQEQQRLREAIAQLPERQRQVLLLKVYGEMKYAEIAALMDLTEGAVRAHFHNAITKLKEVLKADEL